MRGDITSDQDSIDAAKVAVLEEASRLPVERGEIPLVASIREGADNGKGTS